MGRGPGLVTCCRRVRPVCWLTINAAAALMGAAGGQLRAGGRGCLRGGGGVNTLFTAGAALPRLSR